MKLAILTDLHANREAVEAVLAHAAQQRPDRYAFLGDLVGYGADPGWVVDTVHGLARHGAIAVVGNHDHAAVQGAPPSMGEDPREAIAWTRGQLDAAQLDFLAALPLAQVHDELLFVHANAFAPGEWAYVHGRAEALRSLQATRQRITFCGHVHEPRVYHRSASGKAGDLVPSPGMTVPLLARRQWLVIAGSVGQPRDGDPAACYATFDSRRSELTCWRVPYDVETAAAKIRRAGLPAWLADRLAHGA